MSEKLQAKAQDIHHAVSGIEDCASVLQHFRDGDEFQKIFERASAAYGEEIPLPRLTGRQKNRCNVPADTAEQYFKRAYFLPFIDTCLSQLKERFEQQTAIAYQMSTVIPAFMDNCTFSQLEPAAKFYSTFLDGDTLALQTEYTRWQLYWSRQPASTRRPDKILEALQTASQLGTYPLLTTLMRIFTTLPVTTATGERSFSALKYIKNYLRSTMGEERLNGLAHLYINRDIVLDYNAVIDEFGRSNRRLSFT